MDAVRGDRLEARYVLAVTTGMRQGELLALRWRDLDRARGALQVRATLRYIKDQGFVPGSPTTKQSQRRIKLGELAVESLCQHRARQLAQRIKPGEAWEDTTWCSPTPWASQWMG